MPEQPRTPREVFFALVNGIAAGNAQDAATTAPDSAARD